jgi:hypothetical protein
MTGLVPVIHVGPRPAGGRFAPAARLDAGLTQQEFARVTGASLGTVRKWERGEQQPLGRPANAGPLPGARPDAG